MDGRFRAPDDHLAHEWPWRTTARPAGPLQNNEKETQNYKKLSDQYFIIKYKFAALAHISFNKEEYRERS